MDTVFWATMIGSAFGVIAGVGVQFFTQKLLDSNRDRRIRAAIATEARYNIKILDKIRTHLTEIRNAFNSNTLGMIYPYFPFSEGLTIQIGNLTDSGRLYEFFNNDQLASVQSITFNFNVANGNWFNNEFFKERASYIENPEQFNRNAFSNLLRTADRRVDELQLHLDRLVADFSNKRD